MIILRDARIDEVQPVTTIIHAAFAEYAGRLNPPSGAHAETPEQIRAKMEKGGAIMAFDGEICAGVVLFYPDHGSLYLGRLAVLPAYRGKGVGQALVAAVEQKASTSRLPRIWIGVRIALPRNRAFFEWQGYQVTAYHSHEGYSEPTYMTLEKRLSP